METKSTVCKMWMMGMVLVIVATGSAWARPDFVINAQPAALLINAQGSFAVVGDDGSRTTLSSISMMPNVAAGLGFELSPFYVDVTAGAGLVVNSTFRSFMWDVQLAAMYVTSDSLSIGPHIGLITFTNPDWSADQDVTLTGKTGFLAGLQITMGDRIMYLVSVDFITASFGVATGEHFVAEKDTMDLKALAVQFGVRGQF